MEITDGSYYKELFKGIKNIYLCLFIVSMIFLIIEIIEILSKKSKAYNIRNIKNIYTKYKSKYEFINSFNIDMAIYDDRLDCYALNDHFCNTLNSKDKKISRLNFEKLIKKEDYENFSSGDNNSQFSLWIGSNYYNFECSSNNKMKVIYRSENNYVSNTIMLYQDLCEDIKILKSIYREALYPL